LKITADTNLLLRATLRDDAHQTQVAAQALREAELIAVSTSALCEFAWVLNRGFKKPAVQIAQAIERLMLTPKVVLNRPAIEAGLALMAAGGDFADGIIAYEGKWLGSEEFVSFDAKAVSLLKTQGITARLLS
jgi:predicted nucleic-acid-binding protein